MWCSGPAASRLFFLFVVVVVVAAAAAAAVVPGCLCVCVFFLPADGAPALERSMPVY